ncbi:MAG: hypothetical protein HKP51_11075 [Sulfitobacter sp.]|nr:hypothetical protein [Sulfitobacter sp.]
MSTSEPVLLTYRTVILPGLGRVQVPDHMTDAQVLAEVIGADALATPEKKTKKKP